MISYAADMILYCCAASSHNVFDMRERQSLAWALCEAGYETWLIDLRGTVTIAYSYFHSVM